jgi:hypothetical protein
MALPEQAQAVAAVGTLLEPTALELRPALEVPH